MIELSNLWFILLLIITFIFSIVFHELGHWFAMKEHVKNVKIKFVYNNWKKFGFVVGEDKDYLFLSDNQMAGIGIAGIFLGFAFIVIISMIINEALLLTLVPYYFGCEKDIKIIRSLYP